MIVFYLKHYFTFFNVDEHLAVPFLELTRNVWTVLVSFVYAGLLVWAFIESHKINLTHCFNSSMLLVLCCLFVCIVDQTQMYPPINLIIRIATGAPLLIASWDFWKIIEKVLKYFCKSVCVCVWGGVSIP